MHVIPKKSYKHEEPEDKQIQSGIKWLSIPPLMENKKGACFALFHITICCFFNKLYRANFCSQV